MAAAIGGAVGLFTNLVLPWQVALLVAFLAVAVLLAWDRRNGAITDWWPGTQLPLRLAAAAARLERQGWATLPAHPHRDGGLAAYLLIGPGGVFVVEHQVWTWDDTVTRAGSKLMLVAGQSAARVASVRASALSITEVLVERLSHPVPVHPVVTVECPALTWPREVSGVSVLSSGDLVRIVCRVRPVLAAPEVAAVVDQARWRLAQP